MHKIVLTNKVRENDPDYFSVEAGVADNLQHFDHHRPNHREYPSPCNNPAIKPVKDDTIKTIQISHMDSDTLLGIARLLYAEQHFVSDYQIDLELMEYIDLNGSKGVDKNNSTYQFMVGVGVLARKLQFPRMVEEPQDVTIIVRNMLFTSVDRFIEYGKEAIEKSEADYINCKSAQDSRKGLWVVDATDDFNPSRPYEDGVQVVVVYRKHYKTVSIYADPHSSYAFAGQTIAGIEFAGHPKACGSPRGMEVGLEHAIEVFDSI